MSHRTRFLSLLITIAVLPSLSIAFGRDDKIAVGHDVAKAALPELDGIRGNEFLGHLRFLASDEFRGRDTASEEEKIASRYLATQLEGYGVEPIGDEGQGGKRSYFAGMPLHRTTPLVDETQATLTITGAGFSTSAHLKATKDFVTYTRGIAPGERDAPVVFAGYGLKADGVDDYANLDVKGKFVLVLNGRPKTSAPQSASNDRQQRRRRGGFGAMRAKRQAAEAAGAIGLLIVHAPGSDARPFSAQNRWASRSFGHGSLRLGPIGGENERSGGQIPVLMLEDVARDMLVDAAGLTTDHAKGALGGVSMRYRLAVETKALESRNVVGLVRGSDPTLDNEVVVYSAHYDHVGVDPNGEVYNGADDNGSGTCALLEIAQAYTQAAHAPRRSIVFLWVSGEEKGLLGSEWWVNHCTLPKSFEIVANLNMDMVGRSVDNKVSVCPSPKHAGRSTLNDTLEAVAKSEPIELVYDADRFYKRTDSYNFAEKGVPFLFFFTGEHADYHRTTDTVDKINAPTAATIARLAYRIGRATADADHRPQRASDAN